MARVCLFATGGTIASRFDADSGEVRVTSSSRDFEALARARLPEIELSANDFCNLGSYQMDLETAFELVRAIGRTLRQTDVSGVVVTHGTDTLEETAFLADLLIDSEKPVVFTGAQRAADEPDTDGPRNFVSAVRVAGSEAAMGLGSVVVFEDEIHAARDVTKTHTSQVRTFQSAEHGKLGEIDGARVIIHRRPAVRRTFRCTRIEPRVDLIKLVMGADARFVDCALDTGARGIVLEAFGRGNVTRDVLEGVKRATAAGVPVVVTSRCPRGRVAPIYGDSGGIGLLRAGALFGGDLSGIKARILLAVLLGDPGCQEPLEDAIASVAA